MCRKKHVVEASVGEKPLATRRTWLVSVCSFVATTVGVENASASRARSIRSDRAVPLKLVNASAESLLVFWINYDGDAELMTVMDAGEAWTADSYETHAWRVIGANDKLQYAEFVMGDEAKVVEMIKQDGKAVASASEAIPFDGFDGLGGTQEGYHVAEVGAVAATEQGPIAIIAVEGSDVPLPILLGPVEGTSLALSALGISSRRPRTMETWSRSLKEGGVRVERALITRLVSNTFYARLVLLRSDGSRKSLDARPSDALTLAVEDGVPIYVAEQVIQDHKHREMTTLRASQPRAEETVPPPNGPLGPPSSIPSIPFEEPEEPPLKQASLQEACVYQWVGRPSSSGDRAGI